MPDDPADAKPVAEPSPLGARLEAAVHESEQRMLEALAEAVETIRRSGRHESDRVYAQIEALLWLRDALELERPLPPTRGWAASPDLLLEVAKDIRDAPPEAVVEMGSGTSSIVIAACLRKSGGGRLVSLEHDAEHAVRTRAELERHGLSGRATVLDAPLGDVLIAGAAWRWYTVPMAELPPRVEMLFVDGPPGNTGPLARYPALPVLRDRLTSTATIFVDDGVRADEREIIDRWLREDPGFVAHMIPSEKEAWVLRRM